MVTTVAPQDSKQVVDKNAIRPFPKVNVPEAELTELRRRINATRWPERETVPDATQGVQLATTQALARYWGTGYDWRECEARLNAFPQFITEIDGLDIHFIHVRSKHENALPLIVTHGWPGSVVEQMKMVNLFGLLGGVNAVPEVREGKIRSQAVFQHALTAGTFAATALPLFFLLWKNGKAKIFCIVGLVAATVMTFATQTSTSILTYVAGILAVLCWPVRKKMKKVRLGLVVGLVALHLAMKAPVWFLIARIDLTGSSSSYHRAELIDQFVNHFSSWWLIGTKDAATWGWDMWDAQNMYVSVGEAGGLAALVFYILVISRTFGRLGDARKRAQNKKQEWLFWFLGSAIFANVVAFFGVNYFDQSRIAWFALLAMVCACTTPVLNQGISVKLAMGLGDQLSGATSLVVDSGPDTEIEPAGSTRRNLLD